MNLRRTLLLLPGLLLFGLTAHAANPDGLDFSTLQKLMDDQQISSIETLLPVLSKTFPKLFSGYTLVYQSRSPQRGSEPHPRAIVYGSTANFILTFNGDANQKGFNRIETADLDPQSKKYTFREIVFKDGQKPAVSDNNPVECMGCHLDQKPIWDNYPVYPGVYGVTKVVRGQSRDDKDFRDFVQDQNHPGTRYASLLNLGVVEKISAPGATSSSPVEVAPVFAPLSEIPVGQSYILKSPGTGSLESQPSGLSQLLLWHQYERILAELTAHPKYSELRYATIAALFGCSKGAGGMNHFLSLSMGESLISQHKSPNEILEDSRRVLRSYLGSRHSRLQFRDSQQEDPTAQSDEWRQEIESLWAPFRYTLAAFGLESDVWSTSMEPSSSMGSDQGHLSYLATLLFDATVRDSSSFGDFFRKEVLDGGSGPLGSILTPKDSNRFCLKLQSKSLGALTSPTLDQSN